MQDVLEQETVTRISEAEADYLRGGNEPLRSSILTSNSDYLNNPRFRDVYAQMGLKKDGHDLPGAYLIPDINRAFAEVTDGPRLFALLEEERARLPEFAEWLDARYTSSFTAESLQGYAPGTLGARMHDFIASSGMSIDFMFLGEAENDYDYLNKRRIQNHDIEHMVTGLDPSPVGETALIVAHTIMVSNYFSAEFASELNTPAWPLPKVFRLISKGKLAEGVFKGETINTPSMLAVEDAIFALEWAKGLGGLAGLKARAQANAAALDAIVESRDWLGHLCADEANRSITSVCLTVEGADADFIKKFAGLLEAEGAAYDIAGYRDAPAGLRIWCGATVDTADIEALGPWLDWAYASLRS